MSNTMRVTEKGQVTIPQHVRKTLGIEPGSKGTFEVDGDTADMAVLRKVPNPEAVAERLERYAGSADLGMSTEDILALTRS